MLVRKINNICFVFLFLIISATGFSQQSVILDSFEAFEIDNQVYLDWVISAGNSCNGTKIFRSNDTLQFTQIGSIEGICGNPSSPQPFRFIDENPIRNSINYYRLELGVTGFSKIVSIEVIPLSDDGFQVRPNPASTETTIYFSNNNKEAAQLFLYNINGSQVTTITTQESYFDLDVSGYQAGMYVFIIIVPDGGVLSKGKLTVN